MKVSVVTIAYNDVSGLAKTWESIRSQETVAEIEHIIVDGGSTDGTREFLATLPPDVLWSSERDRGRYDAMNKGMASATGDIVWFMHAGDKFGGPSSIQTVVDRVQAASDDAPIWGYGLARKVEDGRVVGMFGDLPFSRAKWLSGGRPIPHQAAFFGSSILEVIGEYDLEHGLAADQLFMMKCLRVSEPIVVADFLCDFDVSGAGSVRPAKHHFRDMRRARKKTNLSPTGNGVLDLARITLARTKAELAQIDRLVK